MKPTSKTLTLLALAALSTAAISAPTPVRADPIKQGTAHNKDLLVVDANGNNVLGLTTASFTATAAANGGARATVTTPTITESGQGHYWALIPASLTGTPGTLSIVFTTATGTVQTDSKDDIVGYDPASDLGAAAIAALPSASANASAVWGATTRTVTGGSVASVTGNVGGSVASVAGGVTVTTNNDKAGYTVSTVQDKTGYSGTATNFVPAPAVAVDSTGRVILQPSQAYSNSVAGTVAPTWYTPPTALPTEYLTAAEQSKLSLLDAAISTRQPSGPVVATIPAIPSWYTAPAAGSVDLSGIPAAVWGYNNRALTAQADTPGITTFLTNYARRTDIPTDYQQRGVAVTLPSSAPTGYGGSSTDSTGVTTLLTRIGIPAGASVSADIAAVKTSADAAKTSADTGSATATVAALKADSQWQQVVSQVVKIYGAEWGGLIKQSDGSYNVLGVNATNVIGSVHPFYDVLGRPTNTTKTVN